jgi:hypothetical protein
VARVSNEPRTVAMQWIRDRWPYRGREITRVRMGDKAQFRYYVSDHPRGFVMLRHAKLFVDRALDDAE